MMESQAYSCPPIGVNLIYRPYTEINEHIIPGADNQVERVGVFVVRVKIARYAQANPVVKPPAPIAEVAEGRLYESIHRVRTADNVGIECACIETDEIGRASCRERVEGREGAGRGEGYRIGVGGGG